MKRSVFGRTVRLARQLLDEEARWGMTELPPAARRSPVPAPVADPPAPGGAIMTLDAFFQVVKSCTKCPLGATRINFVFGVGNPGADLMFVGEGPGYDEDRKGEPFVGRAGQLLTKIIESMGFRRADVYIANIVKCHPMIDPANPDKRGNDRPPTPEEAAACLPYLERQIALIAPRIICALGASAARTLLNIETGISKLRGRFYDYRGTPLMPTYHPAALLRNPAFKKDVWEDMKNIMAELRKPSGTPRA